MTDKSDVRDGIERLREEAAAESDDATDYADPETPLDLSEITYEEARERYQTLVGTPAADESEKQRLYMYIIRHRDDPPADADAESDAAPENETSDAEPERDE